MKTWYKQWLKHPDEVWYSTKADRLYVLKQGTYPPIWYEFVCNL